MSRRVEDRKRMMDFYEKHRKDLEQGLGQATDEAMLKMSNDPLLDITKSLLTQKGFDANKVLSRWQDFKSEFKSETEFLRILAEAKHLHDHDTSIAALKRLESFKDVDPDDVLPDEDAWTSEKWMQSIDLNSLIHEELFAPLRQDEEKSPSRDMAYVMALGKSETSSPIQRVLRKKLADRIADKIHYAARNLADSVRIRGSGATFDQGSKFFDAGEGGKSPPVLTFGELSYFFRGLDRFIGPPNPNLQETIQYEHCESVDSDERFVVNNYGTDTSPKTEYWFVVDPTEARLKTLGIQFWPTEERLFEKENEAVELAALSADKGEKQIEAVRVERRKPLSIKDFSTEMADKNGQLKELNLQSIGQEEFHCGRLYTGCAPETRALRAACGY